jgi:peptidoglycan/LPS O-acetylase OafA/YrhL
MLGLMTYRVMSEDLVRRLIGKSLVQVSIILAIVCLLFFHPTDVVIVALLPALILVLAKGDGASATFFGSPFVFFLGEISYSVYLLHWQYLRILRWTYSYLIQRAGAPLASIGSLLLFAIALLVSSWLAFLFLERPARRWMRKLEGLVGQTREPRFL